MNSKKNLKRNLLICLLAGSAVMYTLPLHAATSVIGNNTLPTGENSLTHNHKFDRGNLEMTITQSGSNGIIKWDSFDVGGSATVNFRGDAGGYNVLNYVNGANASQIYGTINANNNGNIFIVNPAGVQIGNSAQINVGSLYVSNNEMNDDNFNHFMNNADPNNIINYALQGKSTEAALMSLGNINANHVTFEGDGRIVIDSERIKDAAGDDKLGYQNINIKTADDNTGNVIIGYEAYDETNKSYAGANGNSEKDRIATINGNDYITKADGYMWVEDVEQLQAIDTNLSGNYALRNSIDATATENWNKNNGFSSIGVDENGKTNGVGFTGNFDGIDYNIFGLTINRSDETNVGLFGAATNANINNVTLVGGKIIGGTDVGAIVGAAEMTNISNVTNSAKVEGNNSVGGIVGVADATTVENAINTGAVEAKRNDIGGLIGSMTDTNITDNKKSELIGNSYNLGDVSSEGHNVGGLVGHAVNSTIGDGTNLVYNRMDVTGAYNVGGIVGNMTASTVRNAENSGTVLASGSLTDEYNYHTDIANENNLPVGSSLSNGIVSIDVNVANAGGIAGSSSDSSIIKDVTNSGDVSSRKQEGTENINGQNYNYEYYTAGNVGGIVGSAADTNITNATNRENEIRGAHNVGGIAGYFSGTGTIDNIDKGINDGGDIMATGARNGNGFVMESVRQSGDEDFIIGNIGGIVGYMDGKGVKVTGSANRGTVHTENIEDADNVLTISKAANVGGIVGKIDANTNETGLLSDFRNGNYKNASVSKSYNTGNVTGYTGVGGVIGMMYNGSVAGSYNQGAINTTRQVYRGGGSNIDPLNMGGIVGDTTEQTSASAVIYDVYNEGQIGDENFEFYARHVGGIVGRLSGTVEKAYNTGDIYNNDTAVGGIVGWWYNGNIKNVFNTGNITVRSATELQVGGIAGAAETRYKTLENAYNLGTIRGYKEGVDVSNNPQDGTDDNIYVGGIIGRARGKTQLTIRNVYTMGNLYAGVGTYNNDTRTYSYEHTEKNGLGAIYGGNEAPTLQGANYVKYDSDYSDYFKDLSRQSDVNVIEYDDRYTQDEYVFVNVGEQGDKIFSNQDGGAVNNATDNNWRIYKDTTTPILNAFLPNVEDYFNDNNNMTNINTIQYGTAYNPLLTIIKATGDLSYDWKKLGISGAASLAVYGGGLTLDNVDTSGGTGYYSGLLYTDKDLTLIATNKNNEPDATKVSGDIGLGSGAELYGSSVKIEADGTVTVYGSVTATGETADSTGDINITAGDVDVYGTLTTGKPVSIAGIEDSAQAVNTNFENVNNPNEAMIHISERFAHEINSANGATSNITINAGTKLVVGDDGNPILDAEGNKQYVNIGDGNVNLYFGNKEQGLITTSGNLTVTGTGDVYVDSDLDIGGDLTLKGTGADSEVVLDITNIGQVQAKNELAENPASQVTAAEKLHEFMHHFENTNADTDNLITLNSASGDAKLAVDMWDGKKFNLKKFDTTDADGTEHEFKTEIDSMNVTVNGEELCEPGNNHVKDYTYIWVSDGEQLKGIQQSAKENNNFLDFNFALKNDINASDIGNGYEAIGGITGYNGTFDGRGNRIIGLTVSGDNAGIFSTVGKGGVVKDVNIYSGTFTGSDNAGAVAGVNNGRIEGIVTFGNTVTSKGNTVTSKGNAGGIVGVNNSGNFSKNETTGSTNDGVLTGGIYDVESTGSVIAGSSSAVAGGLVGTNNGGLANSFSDSAVTVGTNVTGGTSAGLGGVVGVNTANGDVQFVDSLGVTNGGTNSDKVGGIIGVNNGNMYSGYNESIVSGKDNVGGIIGVNTSTVSNIVNATGINGNDYVGGLVGDNDGNVSSGRNNGTITGNDYVGGMVGSNGAVSKLENLVNAESADIVGEDYVGGIAGTNSGEITADDQSTLDNLGSITGQNYVGGVAGENIGKIEYIKTNISLNVKDTNEDAQYFGGVAGINGRVDDDPNDGVDNDKTGTITSATNEGNVIAADADYVGGIVGLNTANGQLLNSSNAGRVEGANYVGGVAGKNEASITGEANDLVTIDNSGVVIAHEGGAGGIFGENTGNIEYAELTNNGIVSGTYNADKVAGTGGLIGVNSGEIKHSSLKNNIGGQVIGTQNVGGLIGVNTGNIEGGRDEANSYYKYQIYNNGVINVGTWKDDVDSSAEGYGKVEADEFTSQAGTNIGGLIGYNTTKTINGVEQTGSLTAGYNTGAINAGSSTNVGGIVGNNAGTVDQVFNTVMTGVDDKGNTLYGTITGKDNVGGLVGTNSGTLSNAYNTTAVEGSSNVGNAVGNNTTGTITNIYASNTSGNLIGAGYNNGNVTNAYSFAPNDTTATVIFGDDQKNSDSYKGFDFDITGATKDGETAASDGTEDNWKIYAGSGNPLLKVFLTKAEYNGDEEFTYNATYQGLTINSSTINATDKLDAYKNANSLLTATQNKNAGEGYLGIYSQQITASGNGDAFDPNNLGYDIDATYDIKKAQLNITLDDVHRVYGNVGISEGGYQISNIDGWQGSDKDLVNGITISGADGKDFEQTDTALTGSSTGKVTENAGGKYTWSADVTLSEEIAQNYEITTTTLTGNSYVEKADLTISIGNAETVYGDAFTNADYSHTLSGITNGDNAVEIDKLLGGNYVNEVSVEAGRDTANAGTYTDMLGYEDYNELQNYNIKVEKGDITVTKADLTISVGNAETVYGDAFTNADYSHTLSGITNGDNAVEIDKLLGGNYVNEVSVEAGRDTANAGTYTDMLGYEDYNELQNYNIKVEKGDITVTKADLTISVGNAETVYGDAFTNGDYSHTLSGITNGDKADDIDALLGGNYVNGVSVETGKATANAGTYEDKLDFANYNELNNYNIKVEQGDVVVTKADLNIEADNITSAVGNVPKYTGTDIQQGLVNGDTISDTIYNYGVSAGTDVNVEGNYTVGIYVDGSYYELSNPDWSTVTGLDFLKNYNVTFTTGTLTVTEQVMPDLPDNWPNNRWDYLFGDNPFDRNENFRERKAEVNFVDGAMEI